MLLRFVHKSTKPIAPLSVGLNYRELLSPVVSHQSTIFSRVCSSLRCNIYPDRTNSKESTEWILHMGVMGPAAAPLCRRLTVSSSSTWPARRLAARTARSPSPNLCRRKFSPFPVHCLSTAASSSETSTDHYCTYMYV